MNLDPLQRLKSIYIPVITLAICFWTSAVIAQSFHKETRPRIVITADPELDDNNSLIRFLLYSSDVNIEGLIYASSGYHWKGDGKGSKWYVPGREYARFGLDTCPCTSWRWAKNERFIHDVVGAYKKVYPNLKIHNPDYPSPGLLQSKIRNGNIEFDGDFSKNTPGSDLIRSLILDDKPGKLFITAWGGQSTIARALKSIQEQYEFTTSWDAIRKKIVRKVVLLPSGDQDDTYATYIKPNWPDIDYRQFSEGPNYGFGPQLTARSEDLMYLSAAWLKKNVSTRGPLGNLYRVWGDGKQMVKGDRMDFFGFSGYTAAQLKKMGYIVWMPIQEKGSWISEGDDFTFMNMLGNGLRAYEAGGYGGWGGRQVNGLKSDKKEKDNKETYPNFFPAAQLDFAARLKWSVTPNYKDANHAPRLKVEGPLNFLAAPGDTVRINGNVDDPDGDKISVEWWQFRAGTYPGKINILNPNTTKVKVLIPKDAVAGQTIHIIFKATDNGSPSLTGYQRIIITTK